MLRRYLRPWARLSAANVLVAMFMCLVMTNAAYAYKFGDFPGKGDYKVWRHTNNTVNEGLSLLRAVRYDEAIPKFEKAIASYPYDAAYFFNLGVCYEDRNKAGDLRRALGYYKRAAELAPNYWESWNGLGRAQYMLHEFTDSRESFLRAMKAQPPIELAPDVKKSLELAERQMRSASRH